MRVCVLTLVANVRPLVCVLIGISLRTAFMLLRQSSRFLKAADTHNRQAGTGAICVCLCVCIRVYSLYVCVFVKSHLLVFKEALLEVGDRTSNQVIKEAFSEIKRQVMKMTMKRSN